MEIIYKLLKPEIAYYYYFMTIGMNVLHGPPTQTGIVNVNHGLLGSI